MNTNSRGTVTGPELFQRLVHPEGFLAPVLRRLDAVGDGAHAVVEQRAVDETGPDIERVDQFARLSRLKPQVS